MSDSEARMCVMLPLGGGQHWAVPQSCLAEILTLQPEGHEPPGCVSWRGAEVPVLDHGRESGDPWLDSRTGAGLVAVLLGLGGQCCDYWAVALRGSGLAVRGLEEGECEDQPEAAADYALAAFSLDGSLYQVPDLPTLQQQAAAVLA